MAVNAGRRGRGFGGRAAPAKAPADPEAARITGIGMLARRDLARRALRDRLVERGYQQEAADEAVELLAGERLVDDDRFVSNRIASRVSRGHGPRRIRVELEQAGVERALVEAAMKASEIDWARQAAIVLVRRFGPEQPGDERERGIRARFLYYRGFEGDHVRRAFASLGLSVPDDGLDDGDALAGSADDDVDC